MALTNDISLMLLKYCKKRHVFAIANFYHGWHEFDMFSLTHSGYTIEFEIKISRADFHKDFKSKVEKHKVYADKSQINAKPNRFFFVCPPDLIRLDEIPEYAGLIYMDVNQVSSTKGYMLIKNAPLLHKTKVTPSIYKEIATKCYYRYDSVRDRNEGLMIRYQDLKHKVDRLEKSNSILADIRANQ